MNDESNAVAAAVMTPQLPDQRKPDGGRARFGGPFPRIRPRKTLGQEGGEGEAAGQQQG